MDIITINSKIVTLDELKEGDCFILTAEGETKNLTLLLEKPKKNVNLCASNAKCFDLQYNLIVEIDPYCKVLPQRTSIRLESAHIDL